MNRLFLIVGFVVALLFPLACSRSSDPAGPIGNGDPNLTPVPTVPPFQVPPFAGQIVDAARSFLGLTCDGTEHIWAVDEFGPAVLRFTSDLASAGGFGQPSPPPPALWFYDVAAFLGSHLYVTDPAFDQVTRFSTDGTLTAQWGGTGSGPGLFGEAQGIAVDASGNVYVGDPDNYVIQKFTSDGGYISTYNGPSPPGLAANALAFDPSGRILVSDILNIYVLSPGFGLVLSIGETGKTVTHHFDGINDIASDRYGRIYVTDGPADRVAVFAPTGEFLAEWGTHGSGPGQFTQPWGIAVDPQGCVFVSDSLNRIQKFAPPASPTPTSTGTGSPTPTPTSPVLWVDARVRAEWVDMAEGFSASVSLHVGGLLCETANVTISSSMGSVPLICGAGVYSCSTNAIYTPNQSMTLATYTSGGDAYAVFVPLTEILINSAGSTVSWSPLRGTSSVQVSMGGNPVYEISDLTSSPCEVPGTVYATPGAYAIVAVNEQFPPIVNAQPGSSLCVFSKRRKNVVVP